MSKPADGWVSAATASSRLGIRPQTLYAYVSRGVLNPRREGRRSYFSVEELDQLEPRGKRSLRPGRVEVAIDSAITLIDPGGRLFYRGADATTIAMEWSFERTAEWLWSGTDQGEPRPWPVARDTKVPGRTLPDRLRTAVATLSADAPEVDSRPEVATTIGRKLLPQLVAALPPVGEVKKESRASLVSQLWPRLSPLPSTQPRLAALSCALIVMADHELVPSTIAARVAAMAKAPPFDAVLAAMATHAGVVRHGFRTWIEEALRSGSEPPGAYDQVAYHKRDPRADTLVPLVRTAAASGGWRLVELALTDERPPSADLAISALSVACEMVPTAAETIYTIARVAGLLAHIAEEYEHPSMFRLRAGYRGPAPTEEAGNSS
jgi:citrate synthase